MTPELLIEDLAGVGVELWKDGDKLRCRGPRRALTPDLIEGLRQHKAEILERLDGTHGSRDALLNSPVIQDAAEVLELARAHFGELEHPEEAPYPPPEKGRDPLVHRHTAKARFFRDVRVRDLEKRRREGFPPWIRLVDGGGAA